MTSIVRQTALIGGVTVPAIPVSAIEAQGRNYPTRTAAIATVAVGSGFQDNAQGTWSFPVPTGYAFASSPIATHSTNGANTWGDIEAPTVTSVRPLIFANSAISGTGVSYLRAEGKWA